MECRQRDLLLGHVGGDVKPENWELRAVLLLSGVSQGILFIPFGMSG